MTQKTENTADLAIPPALAVRLQAAAEEQHGSVRDVLRDALERYLHAWRPLTTATTQRSPTESAARMMRARQTNIRLDDTALRDLMSHGRA